MSGHTQNLSTIDQSNPGAGWSNGALAPIFPYTQAGRTALYQSERRWIGLYADGGWTRLGEEGHEHDAKTSGGSANTGSGVSVKNSDVAVRSLIAQLCESFYKAGWATGTGGGVSIRLQHPVSKEWRVYVAPSGIQKEDMIAEDIFCLDMERNVVEAPKTPGLRQSACTPLWYVVYKHRPTATCVIHTHSMNAVLATLLDPTEQSKTVKLTCLEMLKGVGNHAYDDVLEIPVIDNRPSEDLLADQLEVAIQRYPLANAVLVRRHGIYCWGDTWEQAKTQCESFDYLLECAIKLRQLHIDPASPPSSGTYREEENNNKKRKVDGFHGLSALDNVKDCSLNTVPLLPRDKQFKVLLLDIEGCTTSISFVHDVLFPYAREHMASFASSLDPTTYQDYVLGLQEEVKSVGGGNVQNSNMQDLAFFLMDRDVKSTVLKDIQGRIWQNGYEKGQLKGHTYSDFFPMLQWLKDKSNVKVLIYSSGSIQAQKLLFAHSTAGDMLSYISGHFDIPSAGPKKDSASYVKIASTLEVSPAEIIFVSDMVAELEAAKEAGIGRTVLSIRPGNAPATADNFRQYPVVHSLLQLCGAE